MIEWRWDQGRILYFQFDVIKEIAKVLVKFESRNLNDSNVNEEFHSSLKREVGLPFAPNDYKVIRNYSRVFQSTLLARNEGTNLIISDICKLLSQDASQISTCDDYLLEVIKRFRYPFPAFNNYETASPRVYPFCALLKFLIALHKKGVEAKASIKDICSYIIGNDCTGQEDIDFYKQLKPTDYTVSKDEYRQIREMLAFISQLSFLKVFQRHLYLDVNGGDDIKYITKYVLQPIGSPPLASKNEEFCQLTKFTQHIISSKPNRNIRHMIGTSLDTLDYEFTEGKRLRVQHLRIERSPLLRKFYILAHPEPICNACELKMEDKYPWVDYMLDMHHLLPLASAIQVSSEGTSLDDLVGLCPSCHRAIHTYYKKWLKSNNQVDFHSKQEAMSVYLEAVREIA